MTRPPRAREAADEREAIRLFKANLTIWTAARISTPEFVRRVLSAKSVSATKDERIVREAGPWAPGPGAGGRNHVDPSKSFWYNGPVIRLEGKDSERTANAAAAAAARILNRLSRARK